MAEIRLGNEATHLKPPSQVLLNQNLIYLNHNSFSLEVNNKNDSNNNVDGDDDDDDDDDDDWADDDGSSTIGDPDRLNHQYDHSFPETAPSLAGAWARKIIRKPILISAPSLASASRGGGSFRPSPSQVPDHDRHDSTDRSQPKTHLAPAPPRPRLEDVPPPPFSVKSQPTHPIGPAPIPANILKEVWPSGTNTEATEDSDDDDADQSEAVIKKYRELREAYRRMAEICDSIEQTQSHKDQIDGRVHNLESTLDSHYRQAISHNLRMQDLGPILRDLFAARSDSKSAEDGIKDFVQELRLAQRTAAVLQSEFLSHYIQEVGPVTLEDFNQTQLAPEPVTEPSIPEELLGISPDLPQDTDPLWLELQDAVAELHLAQENRQILEKVKNAHDEAVRTLQITLKEFNRDDVKRMLDRYIDSDDIDLLDDFEANDNQTAADVQYWRIRVDNLFLQCKSEQVLPKDPPFFDDKGYNPGIDNINLPNPTFQRGSRLPTLEHHYFPLLLSAPIHVMAIPFPLTAKMALEEAHKIASSGALSNAAAMFERRKKEVDIDFPFTAYEKPGEDQSLKMNKTEFVNRWLLNHLRLNPMEVLLCFRIFHAFLKVKNPARWESDVLRFWYSDEAARTPLTQCLSDATSILLDTALTIVPSRAHTSTPPVRKFPTSDMIDDSKSTF